MFHRIVSVFGALMALFSIFFCCMAVYDLMHPETTDTEPGVLIGLFVFFFLTAAVGIYLFVSASRKSRQGGMEKSEREILALIAEKGGRITPHEIALNTRLTVAEAKIHLDRMCADGSGELQITPEGNMVYVFFTFLSEREKMSARNVLEL
ncbi:MAG: winged helix-turn-helix domain-containing protein [Desulfobacterales bacterium]